VGASERELQDIAVVANSGNKLTNVDLKILLCDWGQTHDAIVSRRGYLGERKRGSELC
jgi:hypothetical protein